MIKLPATVAIEMVNPTESSLPATPQGKSGKILHQQIDSLNHEFDLGLPNPELYSPGSHSRTKRSKEEECWIYLKALFWRDYKAFERGLDSFKEEIRAEIKAAARDKRWIHKPRQDSGTIPSRDHFLQTDGYRGISVDERQHRVDVLWNTLRSEVWLLEGGVDPSHSSRTLGRPRNLANGPRRASDNGAELPATTTTPQSKRKSDLEAQVFYTAPNSPNLPPEGKYPSLGNLDEYNGPNRDDFLFDETTMEATDDLDLDDQTSRKSRKRQSKITDHMLISKSDRSPGNKSFQSLASIQNANTVTPGTSFATSVDSVFDPSEHGIETSFGTDVTEPLDDVLTQADSIDAAMQSEDASILLRSIEGEGALSLGPQQAYITAEQKLLNTLIEKGPFSNRISFLDKVPLRAKYELERVRLEWGVDHKHIFVGEKPHEKHADFWSWLGALSVRFNKSLPEKSSPKAWDAAIDRFQGERHSETVVLTGALDWCDEAESGIFKLRLNPLKLDRTCRFHRRFGSDRFLSITIPSSSKAPKYIQESKASLQEVAAKWLSGYDQFLLGRVWRAFFVEEHKIKTTKTKTQTKSEKTRFRVDLFAVDGVDFFKKLHAPALSPPGQSCDVHTRMTVEQLIEWHIPSRENSKQTDCKLFNRIHLGLSKTWATKVLIPNQIRKLPDIDGKPVMNDGCALMSRPLARAICEDLGIDGNTPSCFQGRIAGAKGLWMVDKERAEDGFWIKISDSQLKVKPHPSDFDVSVDKEKLVFEVADWSKPLRPSELNAQMLEVLDNRGRPKNRIAELARTAINDLYIEFKTVIEKDSIPLARALMQKIRPMPEDGSSRNNIRRIDQWIVKDTEAVIRFLEAGFSPRNFVPLRDRLWRCLVDTLNRYVNECHVPVPLSTYAYCIADPYGVLEEDEVHFGFSSQWKDCPEFEDAIVDGVDILVGRNPAHCPWDIQRRKAVWKQDLRHFKDVIVFPTKGDTPLASLLSGGDYDGDRPWICWDPKLVESFNNAMPLDDVPDADHFGLIVHARPMTSVKSTEDFLEGAFKFNLTMSKLGLCTSEHERIAYDEPDGINSPTALELATLLSHLVDSRKAGVQLTDDGWKQYLKKLSPRERTAPAYKDIDAKKGKSSNINDFLKFNVAVAEKNMALQKFHELCESAGEKVRDLDLVRPWQAVWTRAVREKDEESPLLLATLNTIKEQIGQARDKWLSNCNPDVPMPSKVQLATEYLNRIEKPDILHPLGHTWQNSDYEWQTILASAAYYFYWRSPFPLYAAGETLCWIKTGKEPARLIRDCVYVSMKVNGKVARRLADEEVDDAPNDDSEYSDGSDEYDGESVFDGIFSAGQ